MKSILTTLSALCCLGLSAMAVQAETPAQSARSAARAYGAAIRNCQMVWALESMYPPLMYTLADQKAGAGEDSEAKRARRIMGVKADGENAEETPEQAKRRREAGYRKLREEYSQLERRMRASGLTVHDFSVGEATAEYVVSPPTELVRAVKNDKAGRSKAENLQDGNDRTRIVILPTRLTYSAPDARGRIRRIQKDSFIYAIRDEVRSDRRKDSGVQLNKWYFIDGTTNINQIRAFFPRLPLNIKTPPCGEKELR